MAGCPERPSLTPQAQADHQARREREAAALRENLRRRKAQTRAREALAEGCGEVRETDNKSEQNLADS